MNLFLTPLAMVSPLQIVLMGLSVLAVALLAFVVYILTKYLPIISNLFLDVTVQTRPGQDRRLEGETVRFKTEDGVELAGTLTAGDATQPVVVFCHEFSADRHAATRYADFLEEAGFRIFTFDFRGHGDSPAPKGYVSRLWVTGAEQAYLRAALTCLRTRQDVNHDKLGLFGVSRGGVVALCAAAEDRHVKAVVADGAYSAHKTLYDYMRKWVPIFARVRWLYEHHPDWFYRALGWLAIKASELRMRSRVASLEKAFSDLRVPALMVHGERDSYLDVTQARALAELNPEFVELWVIPGANHNEAVVLVADRYHRRLTEFLADNLGAPVPDLDDRNLKTHGGVEV